MRHRARPKLLGLVRLPDRFRPVRPTLPPPGHRARVAAAVAGGLVVVGGGGYAVTALVDDPEAPYAGTGPSPDRTDGQPVSRGSDRPPLPGSSSPSTDPSARTPTRAPATARSSGPAPQNHSGSDSGSPDQPSPTKPADSATVESRSPGTGGTREQSSQQDGDRSGGATSSRSARQSPDQSSPDQSSQESSSPRRSPSSGEDRDAPQTTIDGVLTAAYPSFSFHSDEPGSTFTCSVDGGPYRPCSSSIDLSDLGPGEHSLKVVATDRHGNSDPTPAVTTWVVRESSGLGHH